MATTDNTVDRMRQPTQAVGATRIRELQSSPSVVVRARPAQHGRVARDNSLFVNAFCRFVDHSIRWRQLPGRFGSCNSVWRRFTRWARSGVWDRLYDAGFSDAAVRLFALQSAASNP